MREKNDERWGLGDKSGRSAYDTVGPGGTYNYDTVRTEAAKYVLLLPYVPAGGRFSVVYIV